MNTFTGFLLGMIAEAIIVTVFALWQERKHDANP